ncbi:MAG: GTPase [Candidatus Methanoliparum thermophilum]|uniref:GTPase n=1 Tax=Methanoliparum thermophilum TaxID=2491083 RepID=A0A520KSE3_METT2|nr:ATP/GTP-binding protein [Candidatus Methanoliparum sp. LAM-1]RZN64843.1 MAG: GTPase [Candidatus Methanoliparum thermophilum]BDC36285.1 GTPase [Candidatus Methanoliparum sp. LAM-1]
MSRRLNQVKVYMLGTAGSGKTSFTASFQEWLKLLDIEVVTVNLDPGEMNLPYDPEVDIRDWINLYDVMEKFKLGPNGSQIVCSDEIALKADEIKDSINFFDADIILIDTPGQIELFAYRETGKILIERLGVDNSVILFLFDPIISKRANGFVSLQMLSLSTQFIFSLPQLNILSKSDVIDEDLLKKIMEWYYTPETLYNDLINQKGISKEISIEVLKMLEVIGMQGSLISVSSESLEGMDDVYNFIIQLFKGGEDITDK